MHINVNVLNLVHLKIFEVIILCCVNFTMIKKFLSDQKVIESVQDVIKKVGRAIKQITVGSKN